MMKFKGDLMSYIYMELINVLILFFTLGFGTPWVLVRRFKWESEHSLLNDRAFKFNGQAIDLFGYWILWWLLTILTFGIYSIVVKVKILEWRLNHTEWIEGEIYE